MTFFNEEPLKKAFILNTNYESFMEANIICLFNYKTF